MIDMAKAKIDSELLATETIMQVKKIAHLIADPRVHNQVADKAHKLLDEGTPDQFDKMIKIIREIQEVFPKENPCISFATFFAVYNNMMMLMKIEGLAVDDKKRMELLHEGRSTIPVVMMFSYLFTSLLTETMVAGKE